MQTVTCVSVSIMNCHQTYSYPFLLSLREAHLLVQLWEQSCVQQKNEGKKLFPILILTIMGGCGRVIMQIRLLLANARFLHVCLFSQGALPIHIPIPITILLFIVVITINSNYNLASSPQEPAHSLVTRRKPKPVVPLCVQNLSLLTLQ